MRCSLRRALAAPLLAATLLAAEAAANPKLLDVIAEGKTQTDLGQFDRATQAFQAVIDAPDATPAQRAEALVRLGAARRGAGDHEGAVKAFEGASKAPGLDRDTKRLLVLAVGGAAPSEPRWEKVWSTVTFSVERSDKKRPALAVVWPDVAAPKSYKGDRVPALDFKDSDLSDVFRLFADITSLNVVVFPGVSGKVTFKADDKPWDWSLDQILSANGLAYRWDGRILLVAKPQDLGTPRPHSGKPVDLDHQNRDLREGLTDLATQGGATVEIDPILRGRSTIRLIDVPWDQAFDVIVKVHGIDWSRDGNTLKVFQKPRR